MDKLLFLHNSFPEGFEHNSLLTTNNSNDKPTDFSFFSKNQSKKAAVLQVLITLHLSNKAFVEIFDLPPGFNP